MERAIDELASTATASQADAVAIGNSAWLLCRAGGYLCAIPIEHVIETMRVPAIDAMPGTPPFVRGLSVVRGVAVPVVDTGLLFGESSTTSGRLVSVRANGRTIALLVEAVIGARTLNVADLGELPPLMRHVAGDAVAAIGALDSELLLVLNSACVIPEETLREFDAVMSGA